MPEKKEKVGFSGTEESALGNSLVVQRLGLQALTVRGQVYSLIELKSHKLGSTVKKIKINKKSSYNPLSIVALQT